MSANEPVVLGSTMITGKGTYRLNFTPTGSSVQLWILGAYDLQLKPVCYTYPVTTQETYLVDVCDEAKDRYRFGFNGQEKVNELAGIGNHNTAEFWEYDTRTGRRWNLDPKKKLWESDYTVLGNSPAINIDPLGDDWYKNKSGEAVNDPRVHGRRDMKKYGLKGKYLGSTFTGRTQNGTGVSGGSDGVMNMQGGELSEVEVMPTTEERISMNIGRAVKAGYTPPVLDMDIDMYASAQVKKNVKVAGNLTTTIPSGIQVGYKTNVGGYKDAIDPVNNTYLNYKNNILDFRAMPLRGLSRGDYDPGGRALLTILNYKDVAKMQLDLGRNVNSKFYIGARGVLESPKSIYEVRIPYTIEINMGIRFSNFRWR